MTTRSGLFGARCAQAWRWALLTTQAMAGYDLTGQLGDWGPPQDPVVPVERIPCTPGADEAHMVSTEDQSDPVPEPLRVFTPVEWVRLRVLRDRYQVTRHPFRTREVAHLHFVRWLHQTGRLTR